MITKKTLLITTAFITGVSIFTLGYLAYNRTVPVNYTADQEKEMLLPLIVVFYGEANTAENRNKYRYLSANEMKAILNQAVIDTENAGN